MTSQASRELFPLLPCWRRPRTGLSRSGHICLEGRSRRCRPWWKSSSLSFQVQPLKVSQLAFGSLVPRPPHHPVFDQLQYLNTVSKRSKTGWLVGLGMSLPARNNWVRSIRLPPPIAENYRTHHCVFLCLQLWPLTWAVSCSWQLLPWGTPSAPWWSR